MPDSLDPAIFVLGQGVPKKFHANVAKGILYDVI